LALQAIYLICLPLAARVGVGATTSFGYAYLLTSAIVAVTASSLGLVTSVPLTRAGLDPGAAARHIVASSWIAVILIGAAAGVFGIAGERIVRVLLGPHYGASVGSELGRLVVVMSIWAVVAVGVTVTFPLVFVVSSGRRLPLLAMGALVVHVPAAVVGEVVGGLDGLAVALAATTAVILLGLLATLGAVRSTARGLAIAAAAVGALAALAFGPVPAAAVGLGAYGVLVAAVRLPGLRAAWGYLRALS
ncbi:MAG: hypothetical protein ABI927_06650, partial [Gaiellaceae bacterium]